MKKYLQIGFLVLSAFVIGAFVRSVIAGSLTPPGEPANTMYSLEDIYNLANDSTTADEGSGTIPETPNNVSETGVTLTQVYDAVATALEGVTPSLTWQTDPSLSLCWSNGVYEGANGCSIGNGWTAEGYGAKEYCQYLESDGTTVNATTAQNIWRLPTRAEYSSIVDDTIYNNATEVPGFAVVSYYWSGTQNAELTDSAWNWYTWDGNTNYGDKSGQNHVRCAH